jgi:hypothetical protein
MERFNRASTALCGPFMTCVMLVLSFIVLMYLVVFDLPAFKELVRFLLPS